MQEKEAKTHGTDGMFVPPEGGFGAFEGSFGLKIIDEESKISLKKWPDGQAPEKFRTKKLLMSLMAPTKYNYLFKKVPRLELLANIFDYVDTDQVRIDQNAIGEAWGTPFGGSEQELYLSDRGVLPKNAYFDSLDELNLVHGFTDRHLQAFGPAMTIYGDGSKINILSAKESVIGALVRFCAQNDQDPLLASQSLVDGIVKKWFDYKSGGQGPVSVEGFVKFLTGTGLSVNKKDCQDVLGVESKYFTLKSEATVGSVTRGMSLVVRVDKSGLQRFYFRGQ
jgi:type II secretory pathway component PulK